MELEDGSAGGRGLCVHQYIGLEDACYGVSSNVHDLLPQKLTI